MKVTEQTRRILAYRRFVRRMKDAGYEEVGESGGRLWEIHRGGRYDHEITDVKIAPGGKELWVRIERREAA